MNELLKIYIKKRIDEPTVILSFRILLDNHIANGVESQMTKVEIERNFNRDRKIFGVQTFRRDYVLRQSGNDENAIEQENKKFFIRTEYLEGLSISELQTISDEINEHYLKKDASKHLFLEEIASMFAKNSEEIYSFVIDLLTTRETDKRGQNFEIASYAILKTYYGVKGFELNRFSTVYANDGGVDFASQKAIYQVTTVMNDKKFQEDIEKAPAIKRVIVFRKAVDNFDYTNFDHDLVLDYISVDDLTQHLDYLKSKNSERNFTTLIKTIRDEFRREFYS